MIREAPLLTIVTVAFNDVWSLSKTIRSVAMQQTSFSVEYIIADGGSSDGTSDLVHFWNGFGVIDQFVSAPDRGVYDAMNKGVGMANGEYILFMNAGDVFYSDHDVQFALELLSHSQVDGLLGWGLLKDQIWASWYVKTDAIRMASLGFCHQALFLRRTLLESYPFLTEQGQTDSDTRQLADCIAAGAKISLAKRLLAIRSPSEGISANLELTRSSITKTIRSGYPGLTDNEVQSLITFRRECSHLEELHAILDRVKGKTRRDMAVMALDTVFLRQAKLLKDGDLDKLIDRALSIVRQSDDYRDAHDELLDTVEKKHSLLSDMRRTRSQANDKNAQIREGLVSQGFLSDSSGDIGDVYVSMTTFPARVESLRLVLDSLLCQSVKPKKISLIIGRDEFRNEWQLPKNVLELIGDSFEIVFVEKTANQYDKFLHTWHTNEEQPVVIVDDDVIYPPQALESLLLTSRNFVGCVVANRCNEIAMNPSGELLPYSSWEREVQRDSPRHDLLPTGAGGVLYPQGFFSKCVDQQQILATCPYADDVWLKTMSLKLDVKVKSTSINTDNWRLGYTADMHENALHKSNVDFGLNDIQFNKAFKWLEANSVDWRMRLRS